MLSNKKHKPHGDSQAKHKAHERHKPQSKQEAKEKAAPHKKHHNAHQDKKHTPQSVSSHKGFGHKLWAAERCPALV